MSELERLLKPFARRVRLLRAWKGLAIGLVLGGGAAALWAVLDMTGALWAEWQWLALIVAGAAVLGGAAGLAWPVRSADLARTLDRRAGLKDRIGTAWERAQSSESFDEALRVDALRQLESIKTKQAFPLRVTRLQYGALAAIVLAASVFLLGNTNVTLNPEEREAKEKLAEVASQVERVAKPLEDRVEKGLATIDEKNLARELERFSQELKRAKLTKEEAMRKANELAEKAQKLGDKNLALARESMNEMQSRMAQVELEKAGLTKAELDQLKLQTLEQQMLEQLMQNSKLDQMNSLSKDQQISPEQMAQMGMSDVNRDLMNLSQEQREALKKALEQQAKDLAEKMNESGLTPQEKEALKAAMEANKKLSQALKLSEEAQKAMQEYMQSEQFKELAKLMSEMQQAAQDAQQGKQLSQEDIERLQKAAEEFAKKWADPKEREKMMAQLEDMIEKLKNGELSMQACQQCLGMMGMKMPSFGASGPGKDDTFLDTDKINLSDKEMDEVKRDSQSTSVSGQRDPNRGEESFVELRAPTAPGTQTSVPYTKVLPKYKKQAEEAVNEQKVPEKHKERVKSYFDSLTDGKSKSKDQEKN